ncbi:exodeoxyribonuclease VII small subunit [Candidatus Saccharibacteria bacterium]|nr:exodeoxyribonuclease VII small subunit [Candidatus Saccharibacteria bacterium]
MAENKSINQKITELDTAVNWFYSDDFSLDQAAEKYKSTIKLAKDIQKDLETLKNKIEVIDKDFSKD